MIGWDRCRLELRAPVAGVVTEVNDSLRAGLWFSNQTELIKILPTSDALIRAYVPERNIAHLSAESKGMFYPEALNQQPISADVIHIAPQTTTDLKLKILASTTGGMIAVRENARTGKLVPNEAIYEIILKPSQPLPKLEQNIRGMMFLDGVRISPVERLWDQLVVVFIRESGF